MNNVSVNSKLDHPPEKPTENVFERMNSPTPGHKESAKSRPLGQKNRARTSPPGQKSSKENTKHDTEVMKNSTEMYICLEILRVKHIEAQSFLVEWLLWIFRISEIILHSSINQHKRFIANKYQRYDVTVKKGKPNFSVVF